MSWGAVAPRHILGDRESVRDIPLVFLELRGERELVERLRTVV